MCNCLECKRTNRCRTATCAMAEHPDYRRYRDGNRVEGLFGKLNQHQGRVGKWITLSSSKNARMPSSSTVS